MLGAILDSDSQKLEQLIVENMDHVNDPIGLPFDAPNSRFFGHAALTQMVILQHPDQTLLDIACGMPCGPTIWVLLSHGAKASRHPLGTDLALHNAIKNGRPYTVQAMLLPGRSEVNGVPGTTWKPLMQAIFWNVPDVVAILLSRGADINAVGPSPRGTGTCTVLQLCLQGRASNYKNSALSGRANHNLRLLLEAGVDLAAATTDDTAQSAFEMFIKPWETCPHWAEHLDANEITCLRLFVQKGSSVQTPFDCYPCKAPSGRTFAHQILWHSTSTIAQLAIDNCPPGSTATGSSLLHELLSSCPSTQRHPTTTLRDMRVLLEISVDANTTSINGITPLQLTMQTCPATDLLPRLSLLLSHSANPSLPTHPTTEPLYILATRLTLDSHLPPSALSLLISHIPSHPSAWPPTLFPIPPTQTYASVISSTHRTSPFATAMRAILPLELHSTFQRAYFAVLSSRYLDGMAALAREKMLSAREKREVVWMVGMRRGVDLEGDVDGGLAVALMDDDGDDADQGETQGEPPVAVGEMGGGEGDGTVAAPAVLAATAAIEEEHARPHKAFRFNATPPPIPSSPTHHSTQSPSATSDATEDPFFPAATTQIRWLDPCQAPPPNTMHDGTLAEMLLTQTCSVCGDGRLLTRGEAEAHRRGHEHAGGCERVECGERWCVERRRREGVRGCSDVEMEW